MILPKMATVTLLIASSAAIPAWAGQPANSEPGKDTNLSSYAQIVIVVQQPASLELSYPLMVEALQALPLEEIARRSGSKEKLLAGLEAQFRPIPGPEGAISGLGGAGYLTVFFHGDLSNGEKRKLWAGVVDEFAQRLSKSVGRVEEYRLAARQQQLDRWRQTIDRAEQEVARHSQIIRELESNQSSLSPDQLREQIQQLSERIREMETKRIAWEARREATERQIEQMRAEAKQMSHEAPILQELARLVKLKETQVALLRKAFEANSAPPSAVAEAEANVAEARIKLLEQQQAQVDPGLASQISTLNVRLAEGMIDMVESRKVQSELEKQLAAARAQWAKKVHGGTEEEIAQIRLDLAKRRLTEAIQKLDELKAQSPEAARVSVIPWVGGGMTENIVE